LGKRQWSGRKIIDDFLQKKLCYAVGYMKKISTFVTPIGTKKCHAM
jgi:hypothetical protein